MDKKFSIYDTTYHRHGSVKSAVRKPNKIFWAIIVFVIIIVSVIFGIIMINKSIKNYNIIGERKVLFKAGDELPKLVEDYKEFYAEILSTEEYVELVYKYNKINEKKLVQDTALAFPICELKREFKK